MRIIKAARDEQWLAYTPNAISATRKVVMNNPKIVSAT